MKISSRPVRVALVSGAALTVVGAASAGGALARADRVSPESGSRVVGEATAVSVEGRGVVGSGAEAPKAAPLQPAAESADEDALVEQSGGQEGDEGPGTERLPNKRPAGEGGEYEGPGTDRNAPPAYCTVTPSSWRIAVASATVYAVPGDTETKSRSISDRRADIAGTGRAATVGTADWFEVKVPGASTGWVVGTELEQL